MILYCNAVAISLNKKIFSMTKLDCLHINWEAEGGRGRYFEDA